MAESKPPPPWLFGLTCIPCSAIAYVGFVDTRFDEDYGVAGVVASDAALNIIGVVVLGLVFWRLGLFRRRSVVR